MTLSPRADLLERLQSYILPRVTFISDAQELEKFKTSIVIDRSTVVLGIFPSQNDARFKIFAEIADSKRGSSLLFAAYFHPETTNNVLGLQGTSSPAIVTFEPTDTDVLKSFDRMEDWIISREVRTFADFTFKNREKLKQVKNVHGKVMPGAVYLTQARLRTSQDKKPDDWNEDEDGVWEAEDLIPEDIVELAKKYRDQITFFRTADSDTENLLRRITNLTDSPAFVIVSNLDEQVDRHYALPLQGDDLTAEAIQSFIKEYEAGSAKKSVASGPIPNAKHQPGKVMNVVADIVDEVANESNDDVLVFVYMSKETRDQQDNQAMDSYERVAESLKNVKNVRLRIAST